MKSIFLFFSLISTLLLFSQNKYTENDLIGVWNIKLTSENEIIFNKEDSLKFDSFGYHFQENNVLIIRTTDSRSQCASPRSYNTIETKWKIINDSKIEISNIESKKSPLYYTISKLENGILILDPISENQKLTTVR